MLWYRRMSLGLSGLALTCFVPSLALAQTNSEPAVNGPVTLQGRLVLAIIAGILEFVPYAGPIVSAIPANVPPTMDGRLDDPIWRDAARITQFVQQRPLEGAPASEQTEVYIAYDTQNIYFGIYAHYSDRKLIRASRVDRDQTGRDDTVRVYFDPFLDQQRAYVFSVNAYGVQSDGVLRSTDSTTAALIPSPGGGGGERASVVSSVAGGQGTSVKRRDLLDRLRPRPPENHTSGGVRAGVPGDSSWDALFESAGGMVNDGWTAEMAIPFKSLRYPARPPGEIHRWGFQIERTIDSKDESVVWAPVSRNVLGALRQMGVLEGITNVSTSRNLELLPTFTAVRAGTLDTLNGVYDNLGTQPEAGLNVKYGLTPNVVFDVTFNPDFSQIESDRAQIEVNQRFPVFYPELRPFFLEGQEIYQISAPSQLSLVHTRTLIDPRYGAKLSGKVGNTTVGFLVADDAAAGRIDDRADPSFGDAANIVLGRVRYDLYSESHIGAIVTDREFSDQYSRLGGVDGVFRIGANHRFGFTAVNSDRRSAEGVRRTGSMFDVNLRKQGRHLGYEVAHNQIHPEFGTDLGFVRRTDQKQTTAGVSYRWWPETWIINWEPRLQYERNYDYAGVLQDEVIGSRLNFQFAKSISLYLNVNRDMERYRDVDFWKTRFNVGGNVNTSRRVSVGYSYQQGDQIRFVESPFLGADKVLNLLVNVRPFSRLQSEVNLNTTRFVDVRTNSQVFDIKLLRTRTTYQFTNRLSVRNIIDFDTFEKEIGGNVLVTYRVNAGTVFFVGYDDHFREGTTIDERLFPTSAMLRTNRAIFTKLQYLFRY